MDAMILAAGLGTRLRPLTDTIPKALAPVGGIPILERVARRLVAAGADRIIVNTHPFPEKIRALVRQCDAFGVEVLFSDEPERPLDTGGGLRRARALFRGDAPFILHNCDIFTDIDLRSLYDAHVERADAIATLAVIPAPPQRYLVFDDDGLLGYAPRAGGDDVLARAASGPLVRRGFAGIHVVSPALLDTLPAQDVFSIVTHYMSLVRNGTRVARSDQLDATWIDIGSPEMLAVADEAARRVG